MGGDKRPKVYRSTLVREREEALKQLMLEGHFDESVLNTKGEDIWALIQSESPIEIEEILEKQLPAKSWFAPLSIRVADLVMDVIILKLGQNEPLDSHESAYLGNALVSMFELGASVPTAFNRPRKLGRPPDFSRNVDITYAFCRKTSSKTTATDAYLQLSQEFHLDERQIKNIVKEYESFVREHFPFANEPLWK